MKVLLVLLPLLPLTHNTARASPDTDVTRKIQQGYEWLDNRQLRGLASAGELWCTAGQLQANMERDLSDFGVFVGDLNGVVERITPYYVFCSKSSTEKCPAAVYSNIPDHLHGTDAIKPPNYIPTTHNNELCTQCNFSYFRNVGFFTAFCNDFECANADANSVTVSYKISRSDLYRTTQHTEPINHYSGTGYTCSWAKEQRIYKVDFTRGVTNARSTALVLENTFNHGNIDPTPDVVDSCEYHVDNVKCSSCQLCDYYDPGFYALDCSNIRAGAVTSCAESDVNPFLGYYPKLFVVQTPTPAPTPEPTTPEPTPKPTTPEPTPKPTPKSTSSAPADSYDGGGSVSTPITNSSDDDSITLPLIISVAVIVVLACFAVLYKMYCSDK